MLSDFTITLRERSLSAILYQSSDCQQRLTGSLYYAQRDHPVWYRYWQSQPQVAVSAVVRNIGLVYAAERGGGMRGCSLRMLSH
jgi:hypothetical protein